MTADNYGNPFNHYVTAAHQGNRLVAEPFAVFSRHSRIPPVFRLFRIASLQHIRTVTAVKTAAVNHAFPIKHDIGNVGSV